MFLALFGMLVYAFPGLSYEAFRGNKGTVLANGSKINGTLISSIVANPAVADTGDYSSDQWQTGISWTGIQVNYEFLDVSSIGKKIESVVDEFKQTDDINRISGAKRDVESILRQVSTSNAFSANIGTSGYVPELVFRIPHVEGTFTFEYEASPQALLQSAWPSVNDYPTSFALSFSPAAVNVGTAKTKQANSCLRLLDNSSETAEALLECAQQLTAEERKEFCGTESPTHGGQCSALLNLNKNIYTLRSDASINLLGVTNYNNARFGYSRKVWQGFTGKTWQKGTLYTGFKLGYMQVDTFLVRESLEKFQDTTAATDTLSKIIAYLFNKDEHHKTSGATLDGGISWVSKHFSTSLLFNNLYAPDIVFAPDLHVKNPLAPAFEFGFFFDDAKKWSARLYNDFAPTRSLVGSDLQWRVLTVGYSGHAWYIPAVTLGKRWNLAGQKLSYTELGFKAFSVWNFFLSASDSKEENYSNGIPLSARISTSFEYVF